VELETLDAVALDQPARLAPAHLAFVRVDAAEGNHDVRIGHRGVGDLLVADALAAHLRLGVDGEVDEADLLLAVEVDGLLHRRPAAGAEVLVGGAVVLLAVGVEGVAARHLEVGVGVDRDEVVGVHDGALQDDCILKVNKQPRSRVNPQSRLVITQISGFTWIDAGHDLLIFRN